MVSFAEVYSTLLDCLLPERCPSCAGPTHHGYCDGCRSEFVRVADPCPRCALPRPVTRCPREASEWLVDRVVAPLCYTYPATSQVHALKFSGKRYLGRALGLLLAQRLADEREARVDAVVAVPLHRRRLRERGFNQALEIAHPLASALDLPLTTNAVHKRVATRPQVELDADARLVSVKAAFSVSKRFDGLSVAIVDDVLTTGATVNSLAAALRQAGAERVEAWTVARVL